jgi:hypothetical protein
MASFWAAWKYSMGFRSSGMGSGVELQALIRKRMDKRNARVLKMRRVVMERVLLLMCFFRGIDRFTALQVIGRIDLVLNGESLFQLPEKLLLVTHRFVAIALLDAATGDRKVLVVLFVSEFLSPLTSHTTDTEIILISVTLWAAYQFTILAVGTIDLTARFPGGFRPT